MFSSVFQDTRVWTPVGNPEQALKLPDWTRELANRSCQETGVTERSISTEIRKSVNIHILDVKYPFALAFPKYIYYSYVRRALAAVRLENRSDIGCRAISV